MKNKVLVLDKHIYETEVDLSGTECFMKALVSHDMMDRFNGCLVCVHNHILHTENVSITSFDQGGHMTVPGEVGRYF